MTHRISEYSESANPDQESCERCGTESLSAVALQMATIHAAQAVLVTAIDCSRHYRFTDGKNCRPVTALLRTILDQVPGDTLLVLDQLISSLNENADSVVALIDQGELSPVRMANILWLAAKELRACLLRDAVGMDICLTPDSRTAADRGDEGPCAQDSDDGLDEAINAREYALEG
jgi:hypothetical protein